ncbi:DUF4878 domain-containing protein [Paenibacillus durus]|uniref:Uncharacterized protein n=1 Tax=Paenibacillus durus TaxID=44251 RepID=A0A089HS70_PAEDU|nr:DUF4878 domain-containing protein [Paenibacillus durus]AIQ14866.1 hypothetical protein PDUR_25515 [Paenibacillus durus]
MFVKKSNLILLVMVLLASFSFGSTSFAKESPESKAKEVVKEFLVAMDKGDINKALELVVDTRFSNIDEQIKEYKEYSGTKNFHSLEIVSVDIENEGSLFVNLKDTSTSSDSREVINVKNYSGQWKISLGSSEKESGKSSDFSINTLADHFEFTNFQYGPHYTNDTFTIPSGVSNVVIQGWQYSSNEYPASASYQLARSTWLGYSTYGTPVDVDKKGDYNITLSGASEGSGFCIRIFVGNSSQINGAGNVMYNP